MRNAVLALAVLAALAACRRAETPALQKPRQIVDGFSLSQSDHGQPLWELHSPDAQLHENESKADLDRPKVQFYKAGKLASVLTADAGVVDLQTYDVVMTSDVVVRSLEDGSRLETERLYYTNKTGKFTTDVDVRINKPGGVLHGRGLEANKDLSVIRIFNQRSVLSKAPEG